MNTQVISDENRKLISDYLDIAENEPENFDRFTSLLSDGCTWALMPPGILLNGLENVKMFVRMAMKSRKHDERTNVKIHNWFADNEKFCVEYYHAAFVAGMRVKENICLVCHMTDGKFDKVNEYIDTSGSRIIGMGLKFMPLILWVKGIRYNQTCNHYR